MLHKGTVPKSINFYPHFVDKAGGAGYADVDNLFLFYTIIKNVEIRIRGSSQPPRGVGSQLISDFFFVYCIVYCNE